MDEIFPIYTIIGLVLIIVFLVLSVVYSYKKRKELYEKLDSLSSKQEEMQIREFLSLYSELRLSQKDNNFPGCYIIFNPIKNMYYVGQSENVFIRAKQHFNGKGSTSVYFDYYYGDELTIKFIPLEDSGYSSLNEMEKDYIGRYNAYYRGYNKTRGNQ